MRQTVLLCLALGLCALVASPAQARSVPQGFVGMVLEGPAVDPHVANLSHEMDLMVRSGVESIRTVFPWADEQPYANSSQVPQSKQSQFRDVNGVPTNFDYTDRIVGQAAQRGLAVLPVIWEAPSWAARHPGGNQASPPSSPEALAHYAGALVGRYGPNGSYWAEHPDLPKAPIETWQIWNEPNITPFWMDQPFAADYVADLRAARTAILSADPTAKVAIAGLVNNSWDALQQVYQAGGQGLFDVVAIHPFTKQVNGVVTILRRVRAVMARNGDGAKPLMVTELSWPSAVGKVKKKYLRGFEVTVSQQAERVRDGYATLARWSKRLGIIQVDWYSWLRFDSFKKETFDYAGLRHIAARRPHRIEDKPAAGAFKKEALKLEGCRRKGPRTTNCRRG